jgi:hypothetical protein
MPDNNLPPEITEYELTYMDLVQSDILLKRRLLSSLIKQPTLLGIYSEDIIKEAIEGFIPKKYSLATGIMAWGPHLSKQLDIIIYDNTEAYLNFSAANMVVISPESVKMVIEVKSTVKGVHLKQAIPNLRSAIDIHQMSQPPKIQKRIFTMIIGFKSPRNINNARKICKQNGIDYLFFLSNGKGELNEGQFEQMIAAIHYTLKHGTADNAAYRTELLKEQGYIK